MGIIRRALKASLPESILELTRSGREKYGFSGDYQGWKAAEALCTGKDSPVILFKTRNAMREVKEGRAVFERDSVLFEYPEYSWPVLAGILWAATPLNGRLRVLDFGGALGSHYYQYRRFLDSVSDLRWNVVEQAHYVECGRKEFEDDRLRFFSGIEDCIGIEKPTVALLSCSIQYLEDPHEFLERLVAQEIEFLVFDRTPFIERSTDRLTIQRVPPSIYDASYPAWFFNRGKFMAHFSGGYDLVSEFESRDFVNIPSIYKGFIFRLREIK